MNLNGVFSAAHAAGSQAPSIKLTQEPYFDLMVVALALAVVLILVGYTQVSFARRPADQPSTTISTWVEIIVLVAIFVVLILIKNNY